jgi:hypothetical protein
MGSGLGYSAASGLAGSCLPDIAFGLEGSTYLVY